MSSSVLSVSKGVFVINKKGVSEHKRLKRPQTTNDDNSNIFSNTLWYQSYQKLWKDIEKKLDILNNDMFSNILSSLVHSIKTCYKTTVAEIPTATLLTGINMPDHFELFATLVKEIYKNVTPHVATLHAEDCNSLKYVIESTVYQLVNSTSMKDDEEYEDNKNSKIRKSNCTFSLLQAWYEYLYGPPESRNVTSEKRKCRMRKDAKLLVVIFPDFESFNDKIIQDFILIVNTYLNRLPIVLIFGVATSLSAVHKSLPYHVSSKISVQVFNSQPSTSYLNNVIENIFFSNDCPFHLGGKVFIFFIDIFLFYDLSVKSFVRNFKFAMVEHYSNGNTMALCTKIKNLKKVLEQLGQEDLEKIRELPSVKNIKITKNDQQSRDLIYEKLYDFHVYLSHFNFFLKCLFSLVHDLPKAPLGKQIRELYSTATSRNITKTLEFEECFKLIGFQSKEELKRKLFSMSEILIATMENNKLNKKVANDFLDHLQNYMTEMDNATAVVEETDPKPKELEQCLMDGKLDRKQFREKLLKMSKKSKSLTRYEKVRLEVTQYLKNLFEQHLEEPSSKPFYEIFFYNDMSIRKQIIGSHRAAIHAALNNPQRYLQCDCCKLKNEGTILSSMPDISILYKLHLEYGKLINLFDLLQSFLCIIDSKKINDEPDGKIVVKPELQARFTQAVADLEYLGFIKSSKRKPDFVVRLTWGG